MMSDQQHESADSKHTLAIGAQCIVTCIIIAWTLIFAYYFSYKNHDLFTTFPHLFGRYAINLDNIDFADIGISFAALLLYTIIGHLFIAWFDVYLPRLARLALDFVLGLGIMSVVFELVTIFHLLFQPIVIAGFAIVFLMLGLGALRHARSPLRGASDAADPRFVRSAQLKSYRAGYHASLLRPQTFPGKLFCGAAFALIAILTLLGFYHALLFPETYWDALILYIGYARKIFFQHAFPYKVVAQVGIGLGANYPHLYPLASATIATLVGHWSDVFARAIPPFAGLLSTVLVFHMILRISRDLRIALALALLFRTIPYGIAYFIYASDYSVAILFTTAFLYVALLYIETRLHAYLVFAALIAAFAVHINYIMWLLWLLWVAMIVIAHLQVRRELALADEFGTEADENLRIKKEPDFALNLRPLPLGRFIRRRQLYAILALGLALSAPWYVRNWLLTGNPVYAFFPEIFDGKRINPEVLASAEQEWRENGDGIGRVGATLAEKLRGSWKFFVTSNLAWKLEPVLFGFTLPGVLIFLAILLRRIAVGERFPPAPRPIRLLDHASKFSLLCLIFFVALFLFHYLISDLYLYHTIIILPVMIVFSYYVFYLCNWKVLRLALLAVCLYLALMPGLPFSLMGFKHKTVMRIGGKVYNPLHLVAFRNPGIPRDLFYALEFGDDVRMWDYVNTHLLGEKILTHENRHLVLDESIQLVHLDDWELQKTYTMSDAAEKIAYIKNLGIHYYLYVPMEDKSPINKRVGLDTLKYNPQFMEELFRAGDNILYRFK